MAGESCITTGWGDKQDDSGKSIRLQVVFSQFIADQYGRLAGSTSTKILMEVTVPIVSQGTCSRRSHWGSLVDDTMLCAGETGKDSCTVTFIIRKLDRQQKMLFCRAMVAGRWSAKALMMRGNYKGS